MTATIPTAEPTEIRRGETVVWRKSVPDYPAADGWTITWYFRGAGVGIDVVGVAHGSEHYLATITAAQSQTLDAGRYDWQAWAEKGSGPTLQRYLVGEDWLKVLTGLTSIGPSSTFDGRSDYRKALDNVRAMLAGGASQDVQEYTIGNRQLKRYNKAELVSLESRLTALCNQEVRTEKLQRGHPFFKNINVRFTEPR